MKYSEYQVWFHAFNNAVLAFARRDGFDVYRVQNCASTIADTALAKFKDVDAPDIPDPSSLTNSGIDLQKIVLDVIKQATPEK